VRCIDPIHMGSNAAATAGFVLIAATHAGGLDRPKRTIGTNDYGYWQPYRSVYFDGSCKRARSALIRTALEPFLEASGLLFLATPYA
jgi:hypothetical protein